MSKIYSAGQYDQTFSPKRTQMYQLPKSELEQRPARRHDETTFIANDKGHLLTGVGKSNGNPFGDYVGTWDLPKSIPGPYHLVKTGRAQKNLELLHQKKINTDQSINEAKEQQKPLALQKC
ncbi:Flattop -like protein [Brachionus plicatilis]|uniref:Cilia- and flagella-associated protein 126 n=1 Tax=Brachionus plicatilis TaxID=10195 RepID=A0A3M7RXY7_BRAPC|nr:Flattop -like protein [Brachionus plicatilis]